MCRLTIARDVARNVLGEGERAGAEDGGDDGGNENRTQGARPSAASGWGCGKTSTRFERAIMDGGRDLADPRLMAAEIKVGATSWTEKSLVDSGWYPKGTHSPEGMLRYYASQFSITENDSMYYAIPPPDRAELWVERTPPWFTMNVKAFATLTQHYTDPKRLPPDIREALPEELLGEARVYPKDLGDEILREIAARFRAAIDPLRASGKLGLVLFQYPVWFTASRENERKLFHTRDLVPDCRVAIEFRNAIWMNERHRDRTLALLHDADLVYTCVDEPQGFPSSIPPVAYATSDVALVRFHGQSASRWNKKTESARDRFRYRYTKEQLGEWVPRIKRLAEQTESVHVLMNNCYSDYAVRNARQMIELLGSVELPSARPLQKASKRAETARRPTAG